MGKEERLTSEKRVAVMRAIADGKPREEIKRECKVGGSSIVNIKSTALEDWRAANIGAMDDMISREMMRIDSLEEVVMRDYENSRRSLKPMEYAALMEIGRAHV